MNDFWSDPSARLDYTPAPKRRRFRKRWIVFGLVGAFVLLMILVPKRTPEQIAADKAETAAADAQAAASKAQASATAKATLTDETKALWDRLIEATGPCDRAGEQVAAAGKAGDRYALYSAAKAGEEACRASYSAVRRLDAPTSSAGDVEAAFEKAIESCGSAQTARILAFEKIATVADGDMRPSAVQDAREWTEYAGKGSLACVAGMYVAAGKGGIDPSIFGKAKS